MTTLNPDTLEALARRLVGEALVQGSGIYWRRRAEEFEAAAHRPGIDWPGHATPEQLDAQQARCAEVAQACRNHAALLTGRWEDEP